MPRLNLLVSTTRQWNPGDDFISYGVRRLLEAALGPNINLHLWDRNPDRAADLSVDWEFRTEMMSNVANADALEWMDGVVLAGTPHWAGGMLRPVYEHLNLNPQKLCLAMGLGSSAPLTGLTEAEVAALSRPTTLITTRSRELAVDLDVAIGPKARPLPCPALFSAPEGVPTPSRSGKIGLILQAPGVKWHDVPEVHFEDIIRAARPGAADVEIISVYEPEYVELRRRGTGLPIVYSFEASDYLNILRNYDVVIATRLHGAIAAISAGIPAILLERGDFRVNSAQRMLADVLPVLPPHAAFELARTLTEGRRNEWIERIKETRAAAWQEHLSQLQGHLRSHGGYLRS